jgi:hypothetical protein
MDDCTIILLFLVFFLNFVLVQFFLDLFEAINVQIDMCRQLAECGAVLHPVCAKFVGKDLL